VFDTGGDIRDDGASEWSWRITYTVTQGAWNDARQYLSQQRRHPDSYRLLNDNCVEFAAAVARHAGAALPHYRGLFGVPDPTTLTITLAVIGSHHEFDLGLVLHNPHTHDTASGAPDPPSPTPPCCDVLRILRGAVADPRKLARGLRFEFRAYRVAPGAVAGDQRYRVEITRTNVKQNLYAVRWGDRTSATAALPRPSARGTVSFSHRYRRGFTGSLTVVVVQNGRVLEYVQPLRSRGAAHAQVDPEPAPPAPREFAPRPAA
jgi:hypothetical protein